jgi:fumarate hydratase subunit alpha
MRTIPAAKITEVVARLCQQANYLLPRDVQEALAKALAKEESPRARTILTQIADNARVAQEKSIALCQDTGIAEIFMNLGQDVHVDGEILQDAVNKGVALGYTMGYLRTSIVADPLDRVNTNDNTPAQLTIAMVPGDRIEITVLPKGGGTENASSLRMFSPSAGWPTIVEFVVETVREKGINACPPLIVGVGIGGSFSAVAKLAKSALLRQVGSTPGDRAYAVREKDLLDAVNALGIGPMGMGGRTTALAVHIEHAPCHIACLPVAVAMHCHSLRRMTETI